MVCLAPEPRPSPFTRYVILAHAQIAEFAHTQLHSARARVITDGRKNGEPKLGMTSRVICHFQKSVIPELYLFR